MPMLEKLFIFAFSTPERVIITLIITIIIIVPIIIWLKGKLHF